MLVTSRRPLFLTDPALVVEVIDDTDSEERKVGEDDVRGDRMDGVEVKDRSEDEGGEEGNIAGTTLSTFQV
jgi:hypothetical protein